MTEQIFKNRKINIEKLLSFGFKKTDEGYLYSTDLIDGQMKLTVIADFHGKIDTQVTDNDSGDEYILHRVSSAVGSFVGQVKTEYEEILKEISEKCFEPDVFKSIQSKEIIVYIRETYGDELEFLWQKFPDNAIWRRQDNAKWYGALLTVSARKIGMASDEKIEILDLRIRPEELEKTVDNKRYFPGYHMNKKHWFTVCLNGSVATEELCKRIDESYLLAKK